LLTGLEPAKNYSLHFQDGSSADRTTTGRELMEHGLGVELKAPNSSELVFVSEIASGEANRRPGAKISRE
jgi:hypothetical protein